MSFYSKLIEIIKNKKIVEIPTDKNSYKDFTVVEVEINGVEFDVVSASVDIDFFMKPVFDENNNLRYTNLTPRAKFELKTEYTTMELFEKLLGEEKD